MEFSRRAGCVVAGLLVLGLVALFAATGLDTADKIASAVCALLAVVALCWQYVVPAPRSAAVPPPVTAAGAGAVAVGGDNHAEVSTKFCGPAPPPSSGASGPASVAIGGTSTAAIRTDVQLWP
ncbi:hypothetical protein Aau02nite_26020 [Amorphoplanes auranticolor]|uniref:Uncharacterized protein n=2 Tax=Actinoplanes auranticolor TaxID=47988 RepID=A0A919S9A8_9ACTN|nr:hypothetical protein Aau02nite_26020 [Actinoplanes auranticolor]